MKKTTLTFLAIGLLLSVSLWIGRFSLLKFWYMRGFFNHSPVKSLKLISPEFQADREILARYPLFYPSAGSKDAGPFLNGMIRWEIGDIGYRGPLVLPDFIHSEMNKDWVLKKPLFNKMGLKFNWLKDLQNFDVWDPENNSPAYPVGKNFETYAYPVPSYKDLITWGKLRYLHGKENNRPFEALQEVRHLMRLIFTNDSLVANHVVIQMLQNENQFETILTPKEINGWKFIPEDHLMRAKRYLFAAPAGFDVRLPDERFEEMAKVRVGLCPAVSEALMGYLHMRWFLEKELVHGFKRMDALIQRLPCKKSILIRKWKSDPAPPQVDEFSLAGKKWSLDDMNGHPPLRAALGFKLSTGFQPDFLSGYLNP